jgi:hypothetical protein
VYSRDDARFERRFAVTRPGVARQSARVDRIINHVVPGWFLDHTEVTMDLAFGSNVREHFYSIGRLAGLETDRLTHAVRSILVSADGTTELGAEKRPFAAVQAEHPDGELELRETPDHVRPTSAEQPVLLTSSTRLTRGGQKIGTLSGVEIDPGSGEIMAVVGRSHWWSPQLRLQATALDFSVAGEIRVGPVG